MKSTLKMLAGLVLLVFAAPAAADAHIIGGTGLASGLVHPFLGLDHLLAMVAVGIVAAQMGGKAIWKVPATFVSFMVVGGLLAVAHVNLPAIEPGIALSVVILGVMIAVSKQAPMSVAMACVALFALLHGHAHGNELFAVANPALYATGFVLATAGLHVLGALTGSYAKKTAWRATLLRYAGAGISFAGVLFLFGA